MQHPPSISDAEWEVMNVLWTAAAAMTAGEVVEQLTEKKAWSPKTVKTMLNRLMKKGALEVEGQGNRYLYRPAVRREQCVRVASRSFLSRVFSGSAGPMLIHFVNDAVLSAREIAELQQLLSEKKTNERKTRARRAGGKKGR